MSKILKTIKENSFIQMIFLSLICCFLMIYRIKFSESKRLIFLIWNLFLAWIPYIISILMIIINSKKIPKYFLIIFGFFWLIFFPNAPYIITDFFHLYKTNMPLWYDLALLSAFSITGFFLALISLNNIHEIMNQYIKKIFTWLIICITLLLSGLGIYLGRYLRWNSWDILHNPIAIANDIIHRIRYPFVHLRTYGVTLVFFLILLGGYLVFYSVKQKPLIIQKEDNT